MDRAFEQGLSPRKRMAIGDPDPLNVGNFGVDGFSSTAVNGGPKASANKMLADHERAARGPIDGNQANPDHGFPK